MNPPSPASISPGTYCGQILTGQIAGARACLGRFADDPDPAIHELRKHGKRSRSILLLTKSGMGLETFVRATDLVRSAARRFSEARDARVLCDSLADPIVFGRGELASVNLAPLHGWLADRHAAILAAPDLATEVAAAETELAEVADRLANVAWESCTEAGVKEGWSRNFERGCEARIRAGLTRHPEDLHEWRKRAKTLSVHLQVMSGEFGGSIPLEGVLQADRLGSLLGEHHDLAVLDELLEGEARLDGQAREAVSARIVLRHREIEAEVFDLGAQVFDYEILD
jgi:CHAD domain-containing protein